MFVEINPADANTAGIKDEQMVWLESPEGGKAKSSQTKSSGSGKVQGKGKPTYSTAELADLALQIENAKDDPEALKICGTIWENHARIAPNRRNELGRKAAAKRGELVIAATVESFVDH